MKFILSFILLFTSHFVGFSTDRYWVGGTGNWNNTAHWSATSGGANGASVPASTDNVYFNSSSFTGDGQIVSINVAANCLDFNWTGAATTYLSPTLAGTSALNVYGSLTLISGMAITYSGDITFKATSSGKTITTAGQILLGSFIFNGVGGDWTLQDNLSISGSSKNVSVTNGTFLLNNMNLGCYSIIVNGGVFGSSTNTSLITTSGATGITVSSGTFYAGTGTLALGIGDISQNGGTFNANLADISMWDMNISGGTYNWNTSTISMYSAGALTISGTGTVNTNNQTFTLPTINYNGGTFTFGTSAITVTDFKVGGAITLTTTANLMVTNYTVNHASGIINLGTNTTISGTVTVTSGNFNTANYSLSSSTITVNGGTINLGSSAVTASSTFTISSGSANFASATLTTPYMTVSAGSLDFGSSNVNLTGSLNNELTLNSGSTITKGTSTITFTGANNTPTVPIHIYLGTKAVNNIAFTSGTFPAKFFDGGSINDLNVPVNSWLIFENSKTFTLTGDIISSSTCADYSLFTSDVIGTASNLSLRSGQPALTGIQMRDIANTGASSPLNCTDCVDAGTNSGFSFVSPRGSTTLYWRNTAGGNWGDGTSWSTSSGGASYGCVPTITDNVIFDANSITSSGKTITINKRATALGVNCATLGNWSPAILNSAGKYDILICADLVLSAYIGTITNAGSVYLLGAGNQKITCTGKKLSTGTTYFSNKSTSTVYLEDDGYFGTVNIKSGTLDVQNLAGSAVNNLFFSGDWYRSSTFTPQSNSAKYVIFNGSSDGHIYDATTFYNLKVNSTAYDLITSADVTISNELLISGGTYKNTNSFTTLVSGSVNITSALSTSYLYVNSGTFSYLNNSITGFNLAKGSVWAWGGTINVGVAGSQTTTVLNIGDGAGSSGEAIFDMWSTSTGIVNVADRVLVKSDGVLFVETNGNALNIKTNTADGGTAATSKFQVNSGGQFKQSGGTINVLGAADNNTTAAISFNTGATFTSSNITGGTIVLQSTTGTYDYPVDFGGKTIYNLTVNQSGRIFNQSTNGVILNGSFTITNGTYNAGGNSFSLKGNWTNNDTYTASGNTVTFNGTAAQTIGGANASTFTILDIFNTSTTGVILNKAANISSKLLLRDGFLYSSSTNLLSMADNSTVHTNSAGTDNLPGSLASFIDGPIKKTGNQIFTFPVGDNQGASTVWAPLKIAAPSVSTDAFTCEYIFKSPNTGGYIPWNTGGNMASGLDHASGVEYWTLNRDAGTSAPAVTLYWKDANKSIIANNGSAYTFLADLTVAHWNTSTSKWENMGGSATTPSGFPTGEITSTNAFTSYSPITIGAKTVDNHLPVTLVDFEARKNGSIVNLEWQTESEINSDYFLIEKSLDANVFSQIGSVKAGGNTNQMNSYLAFDYHPQIGINYYRLKMVDYNGDFYYSEIRTVYYSEENIVSDLCDFIVYPTLINSRNTEINISSNCGDNFALSLYDSSGKKVLSQISAGDFHTNFSVESLKNGIYILKISSEKNSLNFKLVVSR